RIAQGVHIVGMPVRGASGPRLHTRTFPNALLTITGGHTSDAANDVRITGIRLDGGMSDDPWTAVGQPDAKGIVISSALNVEIDHDELDHWRGAAVSVQDPEKMIAQANLTTVRIHDNWIHHNQHPSANSCIDSLIGHDHAGGYGVELAGGAY